MFPTYEDPVPCACSCNLNRIYVLHCFRPIEERRVKLLRNLKQVHSRGPLATEIDDTEVCVAMHCAFHYISMVVLQTRNWVQKPMNALLIGAHKLKTLLLRFCIYIAFF